MERDEAHNALQLLRKVASQARDDTAEQNWGIIWFLSAFSNSAGFLGTHVLMHRGHHTPTPYVGLWVGVFVLNGVWIALFKRPSRGVPTFLEKQIWAIWNTLIVAMALTAVINYRVGLSPTLFAPAVFAVLAAGTFSIMATVVQKNWYIPAALWALFSLGITWFPRWQFALFAVAWGLTQGTAGALLHRAKLRSEAPP
ncbi:MAG: hypothetical protein Q8Q09_21920 [Deltaproteobacteria bacterium]|nr:hypothetical protein [Deltaproteobacteria bacterium]